MTDNRNSYDIAKEKMVDQAFEDARIGVNELLDNKEEHIFSERHNKRMEKLFADFEAQKPQKKKTSIKKWQKIVACLVVVFAIGSYLTVTNVEAWKVNLLNFVFEKEQPNSDFTIGENKGTIYTDDKVELNYVPVGFELSDSLSTNAQYMLQFESNEKYYQIIISEYKTNLSIDTENGTYEDLVIQGNDAKYISNDNANFILYQLNNYSVIITGNINKQSLIKIASELTIRT